MLALESLVSCTSSLSKSVRKLCVWGGEGLCGPVCSVCVCVMSAYVQLIVPVKVVLSPSQYTSYYYSVCYSA